MHSATGPLQLANFSLTGVTQLRRCAVRFAKPGLHLKFSVKLKGYRSWNSCAERMAFVPTVGSVQFKTSRKHKKKKSCVAEIQDAY